MASPSEHELAELAALADGTLPAERRAAVEARVAGSPELQALLERQRRATAAANVLAHEPVPESLAASVEASRRGRRARRGVAPRFALAGALALVVTVVSAVVLTGGPGAPTVAEAAGLATAAPSAPAPASESDTRLALDVDGVAFPNLLESYGWRAVGSRSDRVDGRDATVVHYAKDGRRLAYVIVAGSGLPRPDEGESTTRGGVRYQTLPLAGRPAVTWRRDGRTCILLGDAPRDELLALASWPGVSS